MDKGKNIEQRIHKRFKAKDGTFAVLKNHTESHTLGQIIDISKGGLAFKYIINGKSIEGKDRLDIFFTGHGIKLKNIRFKTISDLAIENQISFSSVFMRRCGIQFKNLKIEDRNQLDEFIQLYTSYSINHT